MKRLPITLLKRTVKKKIGSWVEQEFDAKTACGGVTWYRVKDGMGGRGDREDWVADVPHGCVSVHDYQYRKPYWGFVRYKSFTAAMLGEMKRSSHDMAKTLLEIEAKLARVRETVETLRRATMG